MPSPLIAFRISPSCAEKLAQQAHSGESLSQVAQRILAVLLASEPFDLMEEEPAEHRVLAVEARLASLELRLATVEKAQSKLSHYRK